MSMIEPLRILLLSHSPDNPNGGASRLYHLLSEGLTARGHQVNLLHQEAARLPPTRLGSLLAQRFAMPSYISAVGRRSDPTNHDIIMSSSGMAAPLFSQLRRLKTRPGLVNHLHGLSVYDHLSNVSEDLIGHWRTGLPYRLVTGPLPVKWDNHGIRSGDLTIVQNLRDLSWIRPRLSPEAEAVVVSASVHPELMEASETCPALASRSPSEILWFASWESRKGSYYVPGAFRLVREQVPEARLTIGGTGKPAQEILQQFDPRDRANVVVLGRVPVEEQAAIFGRSSIFLFPSLSEGFGLALVEAMCFGLAAVTTDTAFGGDHLTDGANARVVFPSTEHIARAIIQLSTSHEVRRRIAEQGQALGRTFTLQRMIDGYEGAFDRLRTARRLSGGS